MNKRELTILLEGYDALTKGETGDAIDILASIIPGEYLDDEWNVIAWPDEAKKENYVGNFFLGKPIEQSPKYGLKIGNGAVITGKYSNLESVMDFYGNTYRYSDSVSGEVIGLWRKGSDVYVKLAIRTPGLGVTEAVLHAIFLTAIPF